MRVLIRGIIYETVNEAAKALNINAMGIYSAISKGKVDQLGLGKTKPKPIEIGGTTFPSMSAASKALGLDRSFLCQLKSNKSERARDRLRRAIYDFEASRIKHD